MKKWTVYRFPGESGNGREFRWLFTAWLWAIFFSHTRVVELKNNVTGEYTPYWM